MTVTLLDAALGTELSRRGFDTSAPLWSARPLADHPDAVTQVHAENVAAGAQVLTTCTFRTHARNLAPGGLAGREDELNLRAVRCAREAIARAAGGRRVLVAGSIAPLEDCFRPDLVPGDAALRDEHARHARSLASAGVDVLLVETMNCRREAEAAVAAAVATGRPTWCAFTTDGEGRLLSGEDLAEAARAAEDLGAEAVLVNCVPVARVLPEVERLRAAVGVAVGCYPNIGHDREGFRPELMVPPEDFAALLLRCRDAGATLLGGCCGTETRHLAALAAALVR